MTKLEVGTLARVLSRAAVTTEELTEEICEMNRQTCVDIAELRALIRRLRVYRDLLHAPENQEG